MPSREHRLNKMVAAHKSYKQASPILCNSVGNVILIEHGENKIWSACTQFIMYHCVHITNFNWEMTFRGSLGNVPLL